MLECLGYLNAMFSTWQMFSCESVHLTKQDNVHTNTETVQCIRQFTVYVRINIISELFRSVEKVKLFNFILYSSKDHFVLCYYFN